MRDDYLSADWARHHGSITTGLHKLVESIMTSLERLNAHQYDAPWRHERRG